MKKVIFTLLLITCFLNYGNTQIQYTGCNGAIAAGYPITLNPAGTVGARNTFVNTLPGTPCSVGTCAFRTIWTGAQWEIQLSFDGGASYPNTLYINTSASSPNPPDLTLGSWVPQGPCAGQALSTWSGDVQSTVAGTAPEIDVLGLGNSITDGDVTPSISDDTNFGNVDVGSNDLHTFTIDNTAGTGALTVSSINISGVDAADFVIGGITFPASIAAGLTSTFTVTFTPSAVGVRNATVTVNNNDANEAVYDFAVRGTGVTPLADIAITEWITNPGGSDATDEWVEIYNFGATSVDIQNWTLEDEDADNDVITTSSYIIPAGGFVILAKNKSVFETQWFGGCPSANVIDVGGFSFANGTDEIIIKDASANIIWSLAYQNDDASGIAAHYTDAPVFTNRFWGSKAFPGVDRTGNDAATGTLGYENNNTTADPNVMTSTTGDMGSPLNGTFTPSCPEINVLGLGNSISDGDVAPSVLDDTDFGNITTGSNDVHTFTIDNSAGSAALDVSTIVVSGAQLGDFVVGGITLPANIANGASTTFTLTFTPGAVGIRNATITVNNTDTDESVYDFAVTGTGAAPSSPEINILGQGNSISDGDITPSATDDTDFGNVTTGGNDLHTFTIDNSAGTAALDVTTIVVSGTHSGDFVLGGITLPASIASGNTTTFTITFTPGAPGVRNSTITVNNTDSDESVYDFALRGTGVVPLADIAITEWITNPGGNDATDEWVELYNFGATAVDIQNWTIEDEDADNDLITSSNFIIPAGGYVILVDDKSAFEMQWLDGCSSLDVIEITGGLTLANGADEIIIKDASANIVWSVAYQNDDATGIAAQYTEAPTFTNRFWGSKASPGVDRTGNDAATGTLGYENNNTTADPNVMTSTTGDMGSPLDGTYVAPGDIVRGNALEFNGSNSVSIGNYLTPSYTKEAWVMFSGGSGARNILSGDLTNTHALWLLNGYLSAGHESAGYLHVQDPDAFPLNEWQHVAVTYDASSSVMKLYRNGILITTNAAVASFSGNEVNIGVFDGGNYWIGKIDEARIWDHVKTESEIRENMHLASGCESGLLSYHQLNEGTGSTTVDNSGNGNAGTLINSPVWVTSGVNVGNDAASNSNSETITVASGASTQNFINTNAEIEFKSHSAIEDITVTYQAFSPNSISGATGVDIIQNPMWTVIKSSATETMFVDYTFTFPSGTFINTDPTKYSLYHRAMNSEGDWNKVATAFEVTSNTVRFDDLTLSGQFMVVKLSEDLVSDVRGNMYEFDGSSFIDNSATSSGLPQGNAARSIEAWIKTTQTSIGNIVSWGRRSFNNRNGIAVRSNSLAYIGESNDFTGNFVINDGKWHHVALTHDGTTMRMYLDGIFRLSSNRTLNTLDQNLRIGTISLPSSGENYIGSLDEVRIWNIALTQEQIRENMHLTLRGNEAGLVSYFQFNNDDAVGTTGGVKDAVGGSNGTTVNNPSYLVSEVAVAGGVSDRVTIGAAGVYNFPNTDVTIEFGANTPNGELVISRLETEGPTGAESIGNDTDNEYFVVNNYGTNMTFDPLIDFTFNRLNYVSPSDVGVAQASSPLQVYKRDDNAFGATWGTSFGGADNASAGSDAMISFNATNNITSFSQILMVNTGTNSALPVELITFEAFRLNEEKVQLDWTTATEINNDGFYIQRMLDSENEFKEVGFVKGNGNTSNLVNYQFTDYNNQTGVSYYRLKQIDFDGRTDYSEIRTVRQSYDQIESMDVSIYPNPVDNKFEVQFNGFSDEFATVLVKITSIDGKILYKKNVDVYSNKLIIEDLEKISTGLYLISIEFDAKESIVKKFFKE